MNGQYVQPSCSESTGGEHGQPSQGASRIAGRGKARGHSAKARRDTFWLSVTRTFPRRVRKDAAEARLCWTCPSAPGGDGDSAVLTFLCKRS